MGGGRESGREGRNICRPTNTLPQSLIFNLIQKDSVDAERVDGQRFLHFEHGHFLRPQFAFDVHVGIEQGDHDRVGVRVFVPPGKNFLSEGLGFLLFLSVTLDLELGLVELDRGLSELGVFHFQLSLLEELLFRSQMEEARHEGVEDPTHT